MSKLLKIWVAVCFGLIGILASVDAQEKEQRNLLQLTGLVLDGSEEELLPVPLATVAVKSTSRGVYADYDGFFSIVVEKGDTVVFSAIGYKTVEFPVPDTLHENRYSIVQLMTRDTINLPEAVIFPWPSKEHFRLEFLAMDVSSEMHERAMENLADETLARMRQNLPKDGNEHAWKKFFDAWKAGDFKKKKKDE